MMDEIFPHIFRPVLHNNFNITLGKIRLITHAKHIIFTIVLIAFTASFATAQILSVKGNNINLRVEPSTASTVKWQFSHGFPVQIIERKGDWVKVSDFEQDVGWIYGSLLSEKPYVIVRAHRNSKTKINIRKGPSTKTTVVGKAFYGVVFEVLEKKDNWVKVRHESGLEGWVSANLVWGI